MMTEKGRRLRLAVDVGGTFTDVILHDPEEEVLSSAKVLTTPWELSAGVLAGIRAALALKAASGTEVREIVHGSTTGTNALIERTGAKVGLLTTENFRDVLEIGRIMRPEAGLYDFSVDLPAPLTPRRLRLEARERLDAAGRVLAPLDRASVLEAAEVFAREKVEAVAVCFLFSFLNPAHEIEAGRLLSELLPGVPVSLSSQVSPEYREYERTSTVVINAYLTPIMARYLDDLEARLKRELGPARLFVIQANGGSVSAAVARQKAVTTVNSGPAGGVVAAAFYGRKHNRARIVSVDMGGTSFDIGLVEDGLSKVTTEGAFQGLPVKIPIIDLHIIGAGGGSLAWLDPGGALNVGPQSAGADPGPACYGLGGERPTVTDANLVLGRLNPDYFNGGRMPLHPDLAGRAVSSLAGKMGLGLEETALGIIKVVNANMVKAIASVTVQRGIDVREFSLLSFGGAGGVHAVDLARELGLAEAVIPPLPGTFSALGLLVTETRHDYVTALGGLRVDRADPRGLEVMYQAMEAKAAADLAEEGFEAARTRLVRLADLKVLGQTYELTLPWPGTEPVDGPGIEALVAAFTNLYRERYAFFYEGEAIELVNLRVSAFGLNQPVTLPGSEPADPDPGPALKARRPVFYEGVGFLNSAVYDRSRLAPGMKVPGPAVIEEETSTTLLPPGFTAEVALDQGLIIPLGNTAEDRP
ncbi:MAG: hydantoinase/oxoprolinase family protein [Thermodesulfobacteriota bacterium]